MKLGILSSIMDVWTYEEMIDDISKIGYESVEVACWPQGKSERRYAGVSHIDTEHLDGVKAKALLSYAEEKGVELSALAFYPNTLDPNEEKRKANIEHLYSVIDAAASLGVNLVNTFIGRDQSRNVEENLKLVEKIWPPILEYAKKKGVRVAIENCPMLFGPDQWPGGQNIFSSPVLFDKVFEILPYDNFGINFDPSHFVWQQMDYIRVLYEYADKIFHVHFKDIKLLKDKLSRCGVMAYPLDFMIPKLPGLGDVDWGAFISALTDIGYSGYTAAEIEDKAFETGREGVIRSMELTYRYMRNFVI